MQIIFWTDEPARLNPVSAAFSATIRRNDGTDTMAVGRTRPIISSTMAGSPGPTRTTPQPIARSPSQYANPAMKQRSNVTANKTVSRAVNPAHSNDCRSFSPSRPKSHSVSRYTSGFPVVPLRHLLVRHAEEIQDAFRQHGLVQGRHVLQTRQGMQRAEHLTIIRRSFHRILESLAPQLCKLIPHVAPRF